MERFVIDSLHIDWEYFQYWTPSLLLWKIGKILNGKYVFVLKI